MSCIQHNITVIDVAEFERAIRERRVPGAEARIERVDIGFEDGEYTVEPVWADVDRPTTRAFTVRSRPLAERLQRAIEGGVVFTDPFVTRDIYGQTYVSSDCAVLGKRLNVDLTQLGY